MERNENRCAHVVCASATVVFVFVGHRYRCLYRFRAADTAAAAAAGSLLNGSAPARCMPIIVVASLVLAVCVSCYPR